VDEEGRGMRVVHRHKVDLGLLKGGHEVKVSAEAIQLGNQ